MPFETVSGVGRGMVVLDGVVIVEGEGTVLGVNMGRPIVNKSSKSFEKSASLLGG